MKKTLLFVALVLLLLVPAGMFAQDTDAGVVWTSRYNPGSLMANVGVGLGWGQFAVAGGAEWFFYQWRIADVIPVDFSAAVRGGLALGGFDTLNLGAAGLAAVHFSFGGLQNAPVFLEKTDFYSGIGLGFSTVFNGGFGLSEIGGANYFLNDNLAINVEGAWLGRDWYSFAVGVTFKL